MKRAGIQSVQPYIHSVLVAMKLCRSTVHIVRSAVQSGPMDALIGMVSASCRGPPFPGDDIRPSVTQSACVRWPLRACRGSDL